MQLAELVLELELDQKYCFDLFQGIYGDASVLLLDSPTRRYFHHSSDQVCSVLKCGVWFFMDMM